jgi:hypothetical protein
MEPREEPVGKWNLLDAVCVCVYEYLDKHHIELSPIQQARLIKGVYDHCALIQADVSEDVVKSYLFN